MAAKQQSVSTLPRVGHVAEKETCADIDRVSMATRPRTVWTHLVGEIIITRLHNDLADNQF